MSNDALIIFNAIDTDGDGQLSPLELSTRLSDFGMSDEQAGDPMLRLAQHVESLIGPNASGERSARKRMGLSFLGP